MLIISGLIIFFYIKNKKFYDLVKSTWVQYTVKQGDEIRSLALTANIDWKLLAKANKLKSPYYLEQGTILLLPPQKEN
jgi:LysM repeat protein